MKTAIDFITLTVLYFSVCFQKMEAEGQTCIAYKNCILHLFVLCALLHLDADRRFSAIHFESSVCSHELSTFQRSDRWKRRLYEANPIEYCDDGSIWIFISARIPISEKTHLFQNDLLRLHSESMYRAFTAFAKRLPVIGYNRPDHKHSRRHRGIYLLFHLCVIYINNAKPH